MRPLRVTLFFFFQAEDGIRDVAVTGVQTCALPILAPVARQVSQDQSKRVTSSRAPLADATERAASVTGPPIPSPGIAAIRWVFMRLRSEERRVGKECRCRWSQDHVREKLVGGLRLA